MKSLRAIGRVNHGIALVTDTRGLEAFHNALDGVGTEADVEAMYAWALAMRLAGTDEAAVQPYVNVARALASDLGMEHPP